MTKQCIRPAKPKTALDDTAKAWLKENAGSLKPERRSTKQSKKDLAAFRASKVD